MNNQQTPGITPDITSGISRWMVIISWIIIFTGLIWFFDNWLDNEHNPNANLISTPGATTVLERNRAGHYLASGLINHQPVVFLLDTGATMVSIPAHLAKKLQLEYGRQYPVETANGTVTVYATNLNSINLGGIELRNINAAINPHTDSDEILLGMSFLKHLDLLQSGNILTLSAP